MSDLRATLAVLAIFAGIACVTQLSARPSDMLMVELPDWNGEMPRNRSARLEYALVEVYSSGTVTLNGQPVRSRELHEGIEALKMRNPIVLLRLQSEAAYSVLTEALQAIDRAGVSPSRTCLQNIDGFRRYEREPYLELYAPDLPPLSKDNADGTELLDATCYSLLYPEPFY